MLEIRSPNRGGSIGGGTSHSSGGTLPTSHPTSERHPACERCVRLCMDLSWTIKKAEHPRIDAFELWCWRRLLRVSWTTRRSNRSILKEISPEYSLEELMLKLQYSGHLMRRTHWKRTWCWERLKEGEGDNREWDGWMASPTQWTWVWASSRSWWWTGKPGVLQSMGRKESDTTEQLNWLTLLLVGSDTALEWGYEWGGMRMQRDSLCAFCPPFAAETTFSEEPHGFPNHQTLTEDISFDLQTFCYIQHLQPQAWVPPLRILI